MTKCVLDCIIQCVYTYDVEVGWGGGEIKCNYHYSMTFWYTLSTLFFLQNFWLGWGDALTKALFTLSIIKLSGKGRGIGGLTNAKVLVPISIAYIVSIFTKEEKKNNEGPSVFTCSNIDVCFTNVTKW